MPGSILGAEDTVVNKTERLNKTETLLPRSLHFEGERNETLNTHIHIFRLKLCTTFKKKGNRKRNDLVKEAALGWVVGKAHLRKHY